MVKMVAVHMVELGKEQQLVNSVKERLRVVLMELLMLMVAVELEPEEVLMVQVIVQVLLV